MKIIQTPRSMLAWARKAPRPLVMVPTMGALHRGHGELIKKARKLAGPKGSVAVSIFVNPTQFGPREDLSRYPRPFAQDKALCAELGVDAIFHPLPQDMYAGDHTVYVVEETLGATLCGKSRPGHFRGVCTVVSKLFNIVQPDSAVFGRKDYQQLAIIQRMVRDLNFPVKIVPAEIVREKDGLALSSRNAYLSEVERAGAVVLRAALLAARAASGKKKPVQLQELVAKQISTNPLARIDYVEVVDAITLQPALPGTRKKLVAVAVFFGKTRLIDNILLS
ncbi:MAG: pantoate--beta-alanine ligase [Chthoniobacteraceae bacterium]